MSIPNSNNNETQERRAFIIMIVFLVAITANLMLSLSQGFQTNAWQHFVRAGLVLIFGVTTVIATVWNRRGRTENGIWLLIIGLLFTLTGTSLLLAGFGLILAAIELVLAGGIAAIVFPKGKRNRAFIFSGLAAALTYGFDLLPLDYRIPAPTILKGALPIIAVAVVLAVGLYIARQAWRGSLRNKLIVAFIGVTVVATGVLGAYMITTSSNALQENLERELTAATIDRASRIGGLFNEQINALTTLSLNEALQDAVITQNSSYKGSSGNIQAALDTKDLQWRRADEADNNNDPLVRENLSNDVARDLTEYQQVFPANVEVFITDVYGGLAGTTNRTSDYFQADEGWWQAAYNNGEGAVYISEPEFDESAGAVGVQIALPIREQDTGEITGILRTTYIVSPLATILTEKVGQTGEADLFFPGEVVTHFHEGEFGPAEAEEFETLQAVFDQGMVEMEYEGALSVVSQAQVQTLEGNPAVDNLGWVVVLHQQQDEAFAPVNAAIRGFIIVLLVVIALAAAAAYGFSLFLVRPIARLTATAEEVSAGNLDSRAEVITTDEVGTLATTFNTMTSQLQETLGGLEKRVAARTKDLATVARISTVTATIRNPEEMLSNMVHLTQRGFNLYHAHVFTYLKDREELQIVACGYKEGDEHEGTHGTTAIPMSQEKSLVARAARTRQPVIVNDVRSDPGWLPNPLLPDTHAEMAVPMMVGDELLGVLDVQAENVDAFSEEDANIQMTLASQVATALQNAQAYTRAQKQAELESMVNLIGQRIQRTTTIEDTLQTAIRELGKAIGAPRVKASLRSTSATVETTPIEPAEPVLMGKAERSNGSGSIDPESTPAE